MHALKTVFAIVAERLAEHAAERLCVGAERRASAVVFEPDNRRIANIALNNALPIRRPSPRTVSISMTPSLDHHIVHGVAMTQELVAAAYREQHAAIGHIGGKLAFSRDHGVFHDHLLSIGATADEHDIGLREIHGVAHANLAHLDGQTAPLQTTRKGNHVATIAVEVQKLGEQMHDGKRLHIVAHRGMWAHFKESTMAYSSPFAVASRPSSSRRTAGSAV